MPGKMTKDIEVRLSSAALWSGVMSGPVAFAIDLQLRYALVPWSCRRGAAWVLPAISIPLLLVCGFGSLLCWRGLTAAEDGTERPSRMRFMAVSGLLLCAAFALAILANDIPHAFLGPCD